MRREGFHKISRPKITRPYLQRSRTDFASRCHPEYEFLPSDRLLRLKGLSVVLMMGICVVAARLYFLQSSEASRWNELATKQHEQVIRTQEARGTIYDSGGRVLAVSMPTVSLAVRPRAMRNREAVVHKLAPLIALSDRALGERMNTGKTFVWLNRELSSGVADEIAALKLEGVELVPEFKRFYPQGETGFQIVGGVSRDGAGQSGVELAFNEQLCQKDSSDEVDVRRDARGKVVVPPEVDAAKLMDLLEPVSVAEASLPIDTRLTSTSGETSITLSIDTVLQHTLEEAFHAGREKAQARSVYGLVMDADTGEILAMAQERAPGEKPTSAVDELRNSVIQDSYEPGSTMKPIVAALALQAKKLAVSETFDCENGRFRIGRHTISDVHPVGVVPFPQVLIRSSNVCMAKIGMRLGRDQLSSGLISLGFGNRTGLELPGESRGILRPAKEWAEIDVATHSFGHGVSVTPIQLVKAFSAVMNGGWLVRPTIIRRDASKNFSGDGAEQVTRTRIFDEKVSNAIREILVGVTEDEHGTGKSAAIPGVTVAGKTGTAQKLFARARGYDPSRVVASFVGFVDGRQVGVQRRFTSIVIVDEPGVTPRWGGAVAAPIFRDSLEKMLAHFVAQGGGSGSTSRH